MRLKVPILVEANDAQVSSLTIGTNRKINTIAKQIAATVPIYAIVHSLAFHTVGSRCWLTASNCLPAEESRAPYPTHP
jgi:hypothetical protein